jgi:beta-galactosidase GanA
MKKSLLLSISIFYLFCEIGCPQTAGEADTTIPHLRQQGTANQLIVDGEPFLILGGELGNSTASDPDNLGTLWPVFRSMHLNTLLAPVYWEILETEEGKFDFSLVDSLIAGAGHNNMRLVLLWFGTWKNSMSCYVPLWVKKDVSRFPRARDDKDVSMEMLTAFSEENLQADLRAFAALMKHIREVDKGHAVIMVQVENEVGMIPVASDFCKSATVAFIKPVPTGLMQYLQQNKDKLQPEIKELWASNNFKTAGSWEDVFGISTATEELFMTWYYAVYVNRVAAAGKREYPLPMFVNAALNRKGAKPGEYPSGGPLPHLMDIWKAGAPSIDFLSPDIYNVNFADWCRKYHQTNNTLFIPEIMGGENNAAHVFYAIGRYDAIGFSPFSIESVSDPITNRLTSAYRLLEQLTPLILEHQGKGTMTGVLLDKNEISQTLTLDNYRLTFSYEPYDRYAYKGNLSDSAFRTGGIVIAVAPDEFIVAGSGMIVTFASALPDNSQAGIGSIDECRFEKGQWIPYIRLNGDQSHQGRHMRLPNDRFSVQRVKLYRYE